MPFPVKGESFNVRLARGFRVIDPVARLPLPEDRIVCVPNNTFWRRRVRAGECLLVALSANDTVEVVEGKSDSDGQ